MSYVFIDITAARQGFYCKKIFAHHLLTYACIKCKTKKSQDIPSSTFTMISTHYVKNNLLIFFISFSDVSPLGSSFKTQMTLVYTCLNSFSKVSRRVIYFNRIFDLQIEQTMFDMKQSQSAILSWKTVLWDDISGKVFCLAESLTLTREWTDVSRDEVKFCEVFFRVEWEEDVKDVPLMSCHIRNWMGSSIICVSP